jgi:hypothetical protein
MKKQDKVFPYSVSDYDRMISDILARNRGSVGRIAESSFFRIPAVNWDEKNLSLVLWNWRVVTHLTRTFPSLNGCHRMSLMQVVHHPERPIRMTPEDAASCDII